MQPITSLESSAAWIVQLNKAWRSNDLRKEFEAETGLKPLLIGNSLDVEQQAASGAAEQYHRSFRIWATKRLGLEDLAPEDVRDQIKN
ncbi:hypothetical protein GOL41_26920 [Sinorhizobium medicae]|nr:hypothetical protein [Sinorhizobium meliloti]MDX0351619.1 hypothetical protein [Sinorhizobium meliloti]MDX0499551.1 hypothetical protein [Sinorhizobium medicae]MDX1053348.1 hypothetical protein [Sinorhizobium medicae]